MSTLGIVLAAGAGRRFGGPKAVAEKDGVRFVDAAVAALRGAGLDEVVVISGAWNGEVPGADVVHNPHWEEGLSSSVRVAMEVGLTRGAESVLISLVDLPDLTSAQVAAVLATPGELVQARYDGQPSHPVKITRAHFAAVAATAEGDRGARAYLVEHGVTEIALPGSLRDVDRPRLP